MSAQASQLTYRLDRMVALDVAEVMTLELQAYPFPWLEHNFRDTIADGYEAYALRHEERILGYFVAMRGVDEMHLLNIAVAPAWQGRGLARVLLNAVCERARACCMSQIWLEVRVSNHHASAVYSHFGFTVVGRRPGYYPAAAGQREDAQLMSYHLESQA